MSKWIKINNRKYLVRGNWSERELKNQYKSFKEKYKSKWTFEQWCCHAGKVYVSKPIPA